MLGVNYVEVASVAVVQWGEAIVWSAEHFYLVALREGGEIAGGYQRTNKQTLTSYELAFNDRGRGWILI